MGFAIHEWLHLHGYLISWVKTANWRRSCRATAPPSLLGESSRGSLAMDAEVAGVGRGHGIGLVGR